MTRYTLVAALVATCLVTATAVAHQFRSARLDIVEESDIVRVRMVTQADAGPLRAVLPSRCHAVGASSESVRDAERVTQTRYRCVPAGLGGATLAVDGLSAAGRDVIVRWVPTRGSPVTFALRPGHSSARLPSRPRDSLAAFASYVPLGFEHILTGWDHLLFILGLVLLTRRGDRPRPARRLLATVTSFTLGHAVTLTLASLGAFRLRSAPVEAVIAMSIALMAWEVSRPADAPETLSARRPWSIALGFGLLHGLGFAGALSEVGLPEGEVPAALAAFNIGVELGQVAYVFAVLAALALVARLGARALSVTVFTARYAMGILAMYWTFDRLSRMS